MKLFLFRHTQTVNTLDGVFRYNGHIDVDVVEEQLLIFKSYFNYLNQFKISAIYSSDLIRAVKGAKIFSDFFNIPVKTSSSFREVKQGRWEGLSYDEIMKQFPEEADKKFKDYVNYRVKGGENLVDAHNRVIKYLDKIKREHINENIIIVGHGGINTLILLNALNMRLEDFFRIKQDFGCFNEIDYFDSFAKVIKLNYTVL